VEDVNGLIREELRLVKCPSSKRTK